MSKDVIIADDKSAFYMPGMSAIVTNAPTTRPTTTVEKSFDSLPVAAWGENNTFPQDVISDVRKDPEIGTLLDKKARLLYSGGLIYGKITIGNDGAETMTPIDADKDKEIKAWLNRSNINRYLIEAAKDLYWYSNIFPEIVLTKDRKSIVQLCTQAAEECRWSKQNPKSGLIETCYINADWSTISATDPLTKKLSVIDPYYDATESIRKSKGTNFIYPISYSSPGNKYYQLADWNSIRASGWLDVSRAVPKFKKHLLETQTTIKYHIEISDQYWPQKFPDWESLGDEQKIEKKEAELTKFQAVMSGTEKTGNNLFTAMITDVAAQKEYCLWKINVIDDKLKDGKYLEEGKEASLYKMAAVGLHPALVGTMPNNGLGGAGSNIREAYNLHMLMIRPDQDLILEPLNVIRDYNGWDPDIQFRFRNSFMNTLDKGTETTKTIA